MSFPTINEKKAREAPHTPEGIALKAFALFIVIGAIILWLPISNSKGEWTNPITALFTATSAVCVTGLIVVDTGSFFSHFGQMVILCLIQIGGLGIMTLGTFLLIFVGRRLTMQEEFVLMDSLGQKKVYGLKALMGRALLFTLFFELVGAAILSHVFHGRYGSSWPAAIYHGTFHSVSAFCNAGFSLYSDSLTGFREDPVVLSTMAGLIILGGLGFLVLHNIGSIKFWRRNKLVRGRLSLHAKLVLLVTIVLGVTGTIVFLLSEWDGTLANMVIERKLGVALFQSITPRTAGFNMVDMSEIRPFTRFFTMLMMFVGGSPGSTAGGIKTTTIFALIATVVAMIKGREETVVYRRTISPQVVREALSIFVLGISCVICVFGFLLLSEQAALLSTGVLGTDDLLFETVSAFGTVGLSTGVTPELSICGKLAVILCMFIGRLGPLTIALIVGRRDFNQSVRYPSEEVVVG